MALWDGPRQREAYEWFTVELANLRAAFRWAADHDDLDTAVAVAIYAAFLGIWLEQYEPVGWAEELIDRARAVEHRRLAQLYVMAAMCYATGRIDDSFGYADSWPGRPSKADVSTRFRTSSKLHSARRTPLQESPTSGSSGAAASSHEDQALIPLPRHSWSWD